MTQPHLHSPLPAGIDPESAARLAAPFALLADPSRLRILYALVEGGAMCVSDIAAAAGTGESATSHQLAKLRAAGVVTSTRKGREIWYQIADAHIRLLLDVAAEHYLQGDHLLTRGTQP
jgi:DNA-binding transcriptional ArsR family regulator